MLDLFSDIDAPAALEVSRPDPVPAEAAIAAPVAPCASGAPLPSLERIAEVLKAHGALAQDASEEARMDAIVAALALLVAEAQAAPAGLPPADRVLCWVMDSELAKFAPTRVRRALAPLAVSNGEPMFPLYVPASLGAN